MTDKETTTEKSGSTSETKWSQGPWKSSADACGWFIAEDYKDTEKCVVARTVPYYHDAEEEAANARLIAAAPELYEALERCDKAGQVLHIAIERVRLGESIETLVALNRCGGAFHDALVAAQYALAKARGYDWERNND